MPEMQSAAKPFVKLKWDECAVFLVQDVTYEAMDAGTIGLNEGVHDLFVMAMIRAMCSRPGALAKDYFDLAGLIETWARDGGENVMSVSALTLSREGVRVEVDDARGARPARRRAAAACNTTASLLVVRTLAHVMAQAAWTLAYVMA